jgi:hypothetical protein
MGYWLLVASPNAHSSFAASHSPLPIVYILSPIAHRLFFGYWSHCLLPIAHRLFFAIGYWLLRLLPIAALLRPIAHCPNDLIASAIKSFHVLRV